jgi:hypothetical protein
VTTKVVTERNSCGVFRFEGDTPHATCYKSSTEMKHTLIIFDLIQKHIHNLRVKMFAALFFDVLTRFLF